MSQRNHYKKLEVISDIMELATTNTDNLHVFTDFSGHVNEIHVYAYPIDTNYSLRGHKMLIDSHRIGLSDKDALKELKAFKAKFIDVIAQAKSDRQEAV
jgi:hypothetical protein